MTWPLKLRATSFAIVFGVVLMEAVIALIPIGIALCYLGDLDAMRVLRDLTAIALAVALAIAVHGDLGRQGYRKWWRLGA